MPPSHAPAPLRTTRLPIVGAGLGCPRSRLARRTTVCPPLGLPPAAQVDRLARPRQQRADDRQGDDECDGRPEHPQRPQEAPAALGWLHCRSPFIHKHSAGNSTMLTMTLSESHASATTGTAAPRPPRAPALA